MKLIDIATPEGFAEASKLYGEPAARAIRFGLAYGYNNAGLKRGVAGPKIDIKDADFAAFEAAYRKSKP